MAQRITTFLFFTSLACSPLAAQIVPTDIAHLYESSVDSTVSDDFNAATLDTSRWDYRTEQAAANWLQSNVTIDNNGADQYLNLRGGWNRSAGPDGVITGTGSSSGVYSKNAIGFGFYTTRWRVEGIDPNMKSSWHPAIWKANVKPIPGWPRGGLPVNQIEIDLVEFNQNRTQNIQWHSQSIDWARDNQGSTQQTRIQHINWSRDFQDTFWNTHGLEFHPDYIQLWDFDEATQQWSQRGLRITISEAETSEAGRNINRDSAHPGYWILSNYDFFDRTNDLWIPFHDRPIMDTDNFLESDSALQVDHFRFYPLLNGDFDGDLDVDGADFLVWQRGESTEPYSGDDLSDWARNYGTAPIPSQLLTIVPEPSSGLLAAAAFLCALKRHPLGRHACVQLR